MKGFTFSLKGLLLLVTYAAVAAAALKYASGTMGTVAIVASYALIPVAIGLAVWGRKESRAFWVGFAEYSIVFWLLVGFGILDMTSGEFRNGPIGQKLVWVLDRMNMEQLEVIPWEKAEEYGIPAELIPAPEMRTSVLPADYEINSGIPVMIKPDGTIIRAPRLKAPQPQPPYVTTNTPNRLDYFRVCQAIACVLIGLVGGLLAQAKRAALLGGIQELNSADPRKQAVG